MVDWLCVEKRNTFKSIQFRYNKSAINWIMMCFNKPTPFHNLIMLRSPVKIVLPKNKNLNVIEIDTRAVVVVVVGENFPIT